MGKKTYDDGFDRREETELGIARLRELLRAQVRTNKRCVSTGDGELAHSKSTGQSLHDVQIAQHNVLDTGVLHLDDHIGSVEQRRAVRLADGRARDRLVLERREHLLDGTTEFGQQRLLDLCAGGMNFRCVGNCILSPREQCGKPASSPVRASLAECWPAARRVLSPSRVRPGPRECSSLDQT